MMKKAERKIKPVIKMLLGSIFARKPTRKMPLITVLPEYIVSSAARAVKVLKALLAKSKDRFCTLTDCTDRLASNVDGVPPVACWYQVLSVCRNPT